MTEHERLIMLALFSASDDLDAAEDALAQLTGHAMLCEPLSAAGVLGRTVGAQAFVKD